MVNPNVTVAITGLKQGLRSWLAERRLRGKIADLSEQKLDRALHDLGLTRPELFTVSKRNPDHRNRMAKLLEHFKVDPEHTLPRYWGAHQRCRESLRSLPQREKVPRVARLGLGQGRAPGILPERGALRRNFSRLPQG
jgi:uncharacterized protein YjiS (DUF1127 family)